MKKYLTDLLGIFAGAFLVAISISLFVVPHKFISGGISGLSLIIYYLSDVPVSILIFIFNIPIVMIGAKQLGTKFTLYSVAGITMMSSLIYLLRSLDNIIPPITDNTLLAAVYAGVITGIGGGIVFRCGGTLGGTDILGVLIKKKYNLSVGDFLFYSNIAIMAISLIFFKPEIIMYTLISMYVSSVLTDKVQEGINTKTTVMIISDEFEKIADDILKIMKRGVTYLHAEGGFLHNDKKVIMCVATKFELGKLTDIALNIDPKAFISISETKEVLGKGF